MNTCAAYWKALNEADEKLAVLESMLAQGAAPLEEMRKQREAFTAAREEYVRLCEEGVRLDDGRRVWGPDYLTWKRLERNPRGEPYRLEEEIDQLDVRGRIVALDLDWAGLSTLEPLRALRLESLTVAWNTELADLRGIEDMTSLKVLRAYACNLISLDALRGLALEKLVVERNESLKSLTGIEGMTTLEVLNAARCSLGSLAPLGGLSRLRDVNVMNNPDLKDLSGLEDLANLKTLDVRNCDVNSLEALRGGQLERLYIADNKKLRRLDGIEGMSRLRVLNARRCSLSRKEVARWQKVYPFGFFDKQKR